jgi:hypothetical protein
MKRKYGEHRFTGTIVNGVRFWLVMVLLISSFGPMLVSADVGWSDNFDDGDYDGWEIHSGNFSATDGYLESTEFGDWDGYNVSIIGIESNVSTGTWSFDCYVPSGITGNGFTAIFMSPLSDADKEAHIFVEIDTNIVALWWFGTRVDSWYSNFENTWTGINVTVDEESTINVIVNDVHRINYTTPLLTGDYQWFFFNSWTLGQAIDNVVVSDTIDYESLPFNTTPTPPTSPPPTDMTMILLVGGGVAAIVVIVLVVWKVRGR